MSTPELLARVAATEAKIAAAPAIDGHLDPASAARLARGAAPFWLRALPAPGPTLDDGYGPAPTEGLWLRVEPGSSELAPLGGEGQEPSPGGQERPLRAREVGVVAESVVWGTSAAPFPKVFARACIHTTDGLILDVACAIASAEDAAIAQVRPFAAALAAALAVPLASPAPLAEEAPHAAEEQDGLADQGSADQGSADQGSADQGSGAARPLVRFTLGREGERLVLRDLASRGPREGAGVWAAIVAVTLVGAAAAAASLIQELRAGAPWTQLALRAGIAVVFALGAFAFFHVARHAFRYRAAGAPIAVFGDDRVVAAPWVRRDGAIDPRPEGRFGAGVRIAEVNEVLVAPRKERHAVSLDTAHGPIDVADLDSPREAEALRVVVERVLAGVASPARRKTSLMRGRERAAAH